MNAFFKIKRDGTGLWIKMYTTNNPGTEDYYAANASIENRKEGLAHFESFVEDVRRHIAGQPAGQ